MGPMVDRPGHLPRRRASPRPAYFPWSFRRPTSPARCTWATCWTTPSWTPPPAGIACAATTPSGCPAPITPASPPRWWWNASLAEDGITRQQLGREEFERRVWEWKRASTADRIIEQMKASATASIGAVSASPSSPELSRAVTEAFVRLYERGLIYRGAYMVNWCPRCHTALWTSKSCTRTRRAACGTFAIR